MLALRNIVGGACQTLGLPIDDGATERIIGFLTQRFTDHTEKIAESLATANARAWRALEIALAGEAWWDKARALIAPADEKVLAQQVRLFLVASPLPELEGKANVSQRCLHELRAAQASGLPLGRPATDPTLKQAAEFNRYSSPQQFAELEFRCVSQVAVELKTAGYPAIAWLVQQRPAS